LNILITPPEIHFDRGLGISAWHFRDAAKVLLESEKSRDLISPISYLQRHAIELYLKSLIYILHRKYSIPFGENYCLDNPAIFINGKWRALSNTHNLADLYKYFKYIFGACLERLPKTTNWTISNKLEDQINLVSGYDPKSTYFRYPKASSKSQDKKKSTVQAMDLESVIKNLNSSTSGPIKCSVMLDSDENIVATYNLTPEPLENVRKVLSEIIDYLNNLHCAFLGELTKWS
tara:strand:+ start:13058 stop:13756 length:699 start_codon:yes stop_codon:yes gene_type:complete